MAAKKTNTKTKVVSSKKGNTAFCPGNEPDGEKKQGTKALKVQGESEKEKKTIRNMHGAYSQVLDLLLTRKHTDDEIVEIVKENCLDADEKRLHAYCATGRANFNSGRRKAEGFDISKPLVRLYRDGKNLIPYSDRPRAEKISKKKATVDPNNDPLAKYANLGPNVKKVAPKNTNGKKTVLKKKKK